VQQHDSFILVAKNSIWVFEKHTGTPVALVQEKAILSNVDSNQLAGT
jgi:hypothetical protein